MQGLPNVFVYLDDILVTGTDEEAHLHNLEAVFKRLHSAGLTLKNSQCAYSQFLQLST
jgi:hypothetical protein